MGSPLRISPFFYTKNHNSGKKILVEDFNQSESKHSQVQPPAMQLSIVVRDDQVALFFKLLSQGMAVPVQTGSNIRELLCGQLGIREDYLDERIQTIFLNSKAVDDIDATIVEDGSTLALSGPMPGLAGATFRRGGFFSGMRSNISYDKSVSNVQKSSGKIYLKLFNVVVKELGPSFLQRGVWLKGKQLQDFISENSDQLTNGCISAKLDEQDVELTELSQANFTSMMVQLQVETG
jgi:hypothetical protein